MVYVMTHIQPLRVNVSDMDTLTMKSHSLTFCFVMTHVQPLHDSDMGKVRNETPHSFIDL